MTIDKKLDDNSFRNFSEEPSLRVIYASDAKQIIHEALKKQREICAEVYEDFNEDVPENGIKIINKIESAPEPEIGE